MLIIKLHELEGGNMLSRAQSPAVVISMRPRYSQPGFKKKTGGALCPPQIQTSVKFRDRKFVLL